MSPASYRAAPPRVGTTTVEGGLDGLKSTALTQQVQRAGDLDASLVAQAHPLPCLPLLERLVGRGEVGLRLLEQRACLRPVALAGLLGALGRRGGRGGGWGGAGHVGDRVDQGVADAHV